MAAERIDEIISEKAFKQLDDLTAKLSASQSAFIDNVDAAIKLNNAISGSKSFKDLETNTQKATQSVDRMAKAQERARLQEIRLQQAREKAFDSYEAKLRKQEIATAKAAAAAAKAASPYNQLTASLARAEKEALDLGSALGSKSKEFIKASKGVQELRKQVDALEKPIGRLQRNVGNYPMSGFINNIKTMVLGYLSIQALIGTISSTYQAAVAADSTRTALGFIFQSAAVADEKLQELQKTAERLGLNFVSLADSYKSFIGAAVASNFPLEQAEKIFNSVSNAGAKLRLSSDQMQGALLALQQMISKGNVQAEELRGQLGERLPGAFSIAARAMGVTEMKLGDMLKKGEVLASDLLPKLAAELDKTFDNDKTEKVESLSGSMERLKNVFSTLISEQGAIGSFFKVVIDGFTGILKAVSDTVTSSSWAEFYARLTDSKTADDIRFLNETLKSANLSVKSSFDLDVSKANGQQIKAQYDNITVSLNAATKALDIYQKGINDPKSAKAIFSFSGQIDELRKAADLLSSKKSQLELFLPKNIGPVTGLTDEQIKAQKKAADQLRKDQLELSKARIKSAKETLEIIFSDENAALEQRLAALELFSKKSEELIKVDKQIQLSEAGLSAYKIQAIELESANAISKIKTDTRNKDFQIRKEANEKEVKENEKLFNLQIGEAKKADKILLDNLALSVEQRQALLNEGAERELVALATQFANREITEEEYAQKRIEVQRKLNKALLDIEIKNIELLIRLQKAAGKDTASEEKQLAELKQRLSKDTTDAQIQDLERLREREKQLIDKRKEIAQEFGNFAIAIVQGQFQQSEETLKRESEAVDIKKAQDLEAVERSVASEQDKAARIALINAKAQTQKEAIDRRQRQLDLERARFEKAAGIARIIVDTASAVAQALPNIPLSILIGALGAAQLATAVATPLPKFEKGGKKKGSGLAEFGHGTELRIDPDGRVSLTPSTPTVGYVQHGTEFVSNKELMRMISKPDPLTSVGGRQINMDKVIESQERTRKEIVGAISANNRRGAGVGYYSTAKGRNYINRNI